MFETLKPMDPFFESTYAGQIAETLESAGFESIDSSITITAANEAARLKNFCNTEHVPERLYYLLYEMILGSFLESLYTSGRLPEIFNFDSLGGKIQIGDTSVELKGTSNSNEMSEQKLLYWIDTLKSRWQKEAITCRVIKW